jgi:hypothetical protein
MKITEFFNFVNERESIRLKKESGASFPWTEDKILREYKFTNVRREHDKTSRNLIKMYYSRYPDSDKKSILLNCALFRYFGTWEFAQTLGWSSYDRNIEEIREIANIEKLNKRKIFTSAYVISNLGKEGDKIDVVLDEVMKPLQRVLGNLVSISEKNSWQQLAHQMQTMTGFGGSGFMVKETTLDTMYTNFWAGGKPSDYYSWTPIGPGGIRGASRVLGNDSAKKISEEIAFDVIMKLYEAQSGLWLHEGLLAPTDIQFQLCEFDKYERVRLGQGTPKNKYNGRIFHKLSV